VLKIRKDETFVCITKSGAISKAFLSKNSQTLLFQGNCFVCRCRITIRACHRLYSYCVRWQE